jgi:hypothetical protein
MRGWWDGRLLICRVRGWRWKMTRQRMDGRLSICGERGWSNGILFICVVIKAIERAEDGEPEG